MTSQTQRLLLIPVYPTDWVCFMPLRVYLCVREWVCNPVRLYLPVHVRLHALALLCLCACVSASVCSLPRFPLISLVTWVQLLCHHMPMWEGRGHQNKHTHICTHGFLKKGGREATNEDHRSPEPQLQPPPRPITAPSLTAKHHRDATEAERSCQTDPAGTHPHPTGTSSCLSFLPSYLSIS